jgi:hypothetical protein
MCNDYDDHDDHGWRLWHSSREQGMDLPPDHAHQDGEGMFAPPAPQSDIVNCPICKKEHSHDEASSSTNLNHKVSHGATMLFIQADCPVCMEDQVGPPTVALGCGHVYCKDDFIKLGGRVGQDAVDPFQPPTPAANDHDSDDDSAPSLVDPIQPPTPAANDHDSDDDSMPPLIVCPNHVESSEEEDDEDDDRDGDVRPASPWHITTARPGSEDWVHNLNGDLGT